MSGYGGVFISYVRRNDAQWWDPERRASVDHLIAILERAGLAFWLDRRELRIGDRLDAVIAEAIARAAAVLCVVNSDYFASAYCIDEWSYGRQLGRPIVPLCFERLGTHAGSSAMLPFGFPSHLMLNLFEHRPGRWPFLVTSELRKLGLEADVLPDAGDSDEGWGAHVHPSYRVLKAASRGEVLAMIVRCEAARQYGSSGGHHDLNLSLLYLAIGNVETAAGHSKRAVEAMPGRSEPLIYAALVALCREPIARMATQRIHGIEGYLKSCEQLGGPRHLIALLSSVIQAEFYGKNGLKAPPSATRLGAEITEASLRRAPDETERFLDMLERYQRQDLTRGRG